MAITKIWCIKTDASATLKYVGNKQKTETKDDDLAKALTYLNHDTCTEEKCFVTGLNCSPSTAIEEMKCTKKLYMKQGGIQAFHAVQSFMPGEITPDIAHKVGVELAQRLWGDRFEVVVATHLDRNHIHSHFVINSVSFKDGKRYYDNKDTYRKFRQESDIICEQYGLKVITPDGHGLSHYQYNLEPRRRDLIAEDVDRVLEVSRTLPMFIREMKKLGYDVKTGKHIAVKPSWSKRYFRLYKLYGDKYADENILNIIQTNNTVGWEPFSYATYPKKEAQKLKGFKALYFKYMYMLGILPKENTNKKRVHFYLKEDLIYMDEISKQSDFLSKNNIETTEDLELFEGKLSNKCIELINERKSLYGKVKRCRNPESKKLLEQDIATITEELTTLRHDIKHISDIKKRSSKMKNNLDKVDSLEKETHLEKNNETNIDIRK